MRIVKRKVKGQIKIKVKTKRADTKGKDKC